MGTGVGTGVGTDVGTGVRMGVGTGIGTGVGMGAFSRVETGVGTRIKKGVGTRGSVPAKRLAAAGESDASVHDEARSLVLRNINASLSAWPTMERVSCSSSFASSITSSSAELPLKKYSSHSLFRRIAGALTLSPTIVLVNSAVEILNQRLYSAKSCAP